MTTNDTIFLLLIVLSVVSYIIVFILGLIIGIFWLNRGVNNTILNKFDKNVLNKTNNKISIDDSKFVTDIKTDGMEKKYATIGETKNSSDNITESITKLKNIKR